MDILSSKRSEALTIILAVIIIAAFLGWLISFGSRECNSDRDCEDGHYCGSDFSCHKIPIIEQTIVKNNLIIPSAIIGTAIVISALILKSGNVSFKKKKSSMLPESNEGGSHEGHESSKMH